jgi:hypothetical protein
LIFVDECLERALGDSGFTVNALIRSDVRHRIARAIATARTDGDVKSAKPVIPPARFRPDLPESLSELCRKCLAATPSDRYETIDEVRSVLCGILGSAG